MIGSRGYKEALCAITKPGSNIFKNTIFQQKPQLHFICCVILLEVEVAFSF